MPSRVGWLLAVGLSLAACSEEAPEAMPGVRPLGRVATGSAGELRFDWPGSGFGARFQGSGLRVRLANQGPLPQRVAVSVDRGAPRMLEVAPGEAEYELARDLPVAEHILVLAREQEGQRGALALTASELVDGSWLGVEPSGRRLEVIGDSTSAGFGALGQLGDADCFRSQSHWLSYGAYAARALGAELTTIAASGVGVTRNYGGAGLTMLELYDRALVEEPAEAEYGESADAVIINLGANDINAGKGDPGRAFEDGYLALLAKVRRRHPRAWILCMVAPTLQGAQLRRVGAHIRRAIDEAGEPRVRWFAGIATQPPGRYACAYHPNPAQHAHMGRALAAELAALLGWPATFSEPG